MGYPHERYFCKIRIPYICYCSTFFAIKKKNLFIFGARIHFGSIRSPSEYIIRIESLIMMCIIAEKFGGSSTMITFDKLWKTMRQKGASQYRLINEYKISASQIGRLIKNAQCSIRTLERLSEILDCNIGDIVEYN